MAGLTSLVVLLLVLADDTPVSDAWFELVGEIAPDIQALHKRLEPRYPIENIEAYEKFYAKNEKWGE